MPVAVISIADDRADVDEVAVVILAGQVNGAGRAVMSRHVAHAVDHPQIALIVPGMSFLPFHVEEDFIRLFLRRRVSNYSLLPINKLAVIDIESFQRLAVCNLYGLPESASLDEYLGGHSLGIAH